MWAVLIVFLIRFNSEIWSGIKRFYESARPCSSPIAYSLGLFDQRFNISKEEFLNDIRVAEEIWEKPSGLDLFGYSEGGDLKINLVYDYRQEATKKLESLGLVIKNDKATYDALQNKYEGADKDYQAAKLEFGSELESYNKNKASYEADVKYWGRREGISRAEYENLERRRNELNAQFDSLKLMQSRLIKLVEELNALAVVLNRLADILNLNAARFNSFGASRGEEFEEGLYESDSSGRRIDIYQYDTKLRLIRVIAHELGHALGLGHVDDSGAIMYRYNQGTREKLANSDLDALRKKCSR